MYVPPLEIQLRTYIFLLINTKVHIIFPNKFFEQSSTETN